MAVACFTKRHNWSLSHVGCLWIGYIQHYALELSVRGGKEKEIYLLAPSSFLLAPGQ